jgi:hypothetical protein
MRVSDPFQPEGKTMTDTTITLTSDDRTAAALVSTIRAAVNGEGKYRAYVSDHDVTRETVKDHARALATLAYPSDKPVQASKGVRTRFGNAVQAAGNGLRAALDSEDSETGETVVNLLTRAGLKADLDDVIAAWEAAQQNN